MRTISSCLLVKKKVCQHFHKEFNRRSQSIVRPALVNKFSFKLVIYAWNYRLLPWRLFHRSEPWRGRRWMCKCRLFLCSLFFTGRVVSILMEWMQLIVSFPKSFSLMWFLFAEKDVLELKVPCSWVQKKFWFLSKSSASSHSP